MAYTSLFKKDDVKITTPFSSSHKGLDLSRGVVRQPIYLPNRAVSGTVWKILPSYTKNGVEYKDAPIIYVKHKDGSGSRYIHSYPKDVKVKVGDTVVAGQQICCTGNSGHSHGDHLHFEWLTKWDDLNTRVDPAPYVMNDKEATFKVGDKVVFTGVQNIRKGSGTNYQITGETKVGDVYEIEDGPRFANGYTWYDLKGADWVADVGKFKIYEKPEIPPVSPPQPSPCEECIKQVEILKEENKGLNEALEKSKNETKLAKEREVYLEGVVEEYKASEKSLTERNEYLEQEVARLEKEKGELEYELSQLKNNKQFFDKIIEWLNNLLKKVFGGK
jgi:hypothetical protein